MESKILSQYEIDALLHSLATDDQPHEQEPTRAATSANVKSYDFRRPDKFSKDHMRTLQMIHESFARQLGSSLTAFLRLPVQPRLVSVEQLIHDEYIARIPSPTCLGIVSLNPLPGRAFLEISLPIAFGFLDRLLGGSARPISVQRDPTDIEMSLLQNAMGVTLGAIRDAWDNVIELEPTLEEISLSPHMIQGLLPTDVMVVFGFELQLSGIGGTLSMALPYALLEPVLPKLSAQLWFASGHRANGQEESNGLRRQVEKIAVPVQAQLGTAVVTLRELIDLQRGDVVALDTFIRDEVLVLVQGNIKYYGRPGTVNKRMAVQLTRVIADHEEEESGR